MLYQSPAVSGVPVQICNGSKPVSEAWKTHFPVGRIKIHVDYSVYLLHVFYHFKCHTLKIKTERNSPPAENMEYGEKVHIFLNNGLTG